MDTYLDRLKFLVNRFGDGKYTVFAKKCGIPISTFKTYYEGESRPNSDHLEKIVSFTEVNLNWLLVAKGEPFISEGGSAEKPQQDMAFREELLREIILAVEEWLSRRGLTLAPPQKADLVIILYRHFRETGGLVDKDTVGRFFLQLVA